MSLIIIFTGEKEGLKKMSLSERQRQIASKFSLHGPICMFGFHTRYSYRFPFLCTIHTAVCQRGRTGSRNVFHRLCELHSSIGVDWSELEVRIIIKLKQAAAESRLSVYSCQSWGKEGRVRK